MHSFKDFSGRKVGAFHEYVRSQDVFGQPVTLNFAGASAIQSFPGGALSIFISACWWMFALLGFKQMVCYQGWTLSQQTVLQTPSEMSSPLHFRDFANVSVALQFKLKRQPQHL